MSTAMSVQGKMKGHQIHQFMRVEYMMNGRYPDKKEFGILLKRHRIKFKVVSEDLSVLTSGQYRKIHVWVKTYSLV